MQTAKNEMTFHYVPHEPEEQQLTLMYCNGINNDRPNAESCALLIFNMFKKCVLLCHNPTTPLELVLKTNDESLSNALRTRILQEIEKKHVFLFAHSHGTLLTKMALEKLDTTSRSKISVQAFGGIATIPKNFGRCVSNWMINGDHLASIVGQWIEEGDMRLLIRSGLIWGHLSPFLSPQKIGTIALSILADKQSNELEKAIYDQAVIDSLGDQSKIKECEAVYLQVFKAYNIIFIGDNNLTFNNLKKIYRSIIEMGSWLFGQDEYPGAINELEAQYALSHNFGTYMQQLEKSLEAKAVKLLED